MELFLQTWHPVFSELDHLAQNAVRINETFALQRSNYFFLEPTFKVGFVHDALYPYRMFTTKPADMSSLIE